LDPFYQQFWVTGYGLKLRMSPFNAVVAKYSLEAYSRRVTGRHRCLEYLSAGLADLPELQIPVIKPVVYMGAWYGYKPLYNSSKLGGLSREKYVAALKAEGVEVDIPGSPALSSLPLFRLKSDRMYREQTGKRVYAAGQFRVAESLASRALSMPTFTDWRKSKPVIDQYITAFHKVHDLAKELL
jgi:dTDP-4-amino-4,6-dideoxygalactose transaminase